MDAEIGSKGPVSYRWKGITMNKKKFDGSISEIMVAYKPDGSLDFEPIRKMVDFQVENHIDGLFMGGLSTQTYLLTQQEKKQVCEELMKAAAGRVPVMMNVMEDSIADAKELVQAYMDMGVDAVCISQPSVFPYTGQALYEFFDELIPENYPTYLYNVPQTGNTMSPSVTARIVNDHPNVLGYKDSTQNIAGLQELMAQVKNPDFQYIAGSDSMTLPMMALGGVGVISAISVPFPKVVLDITDRFFAGDMQGALEAHRFSMKVRRLLKTATDMNGYYYACELLDMPFHGTRMPKNMTEMTEEQKRIIRTGLEEMKLI